MFFQDNTDLDFSNHFQKINALVEFLFGNFFVLFGSLLQVGLRTGHVLLGMLVERL